jgi:hypothetical protein
VAILDHEFHVKFPVRGTIYFTDFFKGKNAPIFIESLSDRYIVFYSHLKLPTEYKNQQVKYVYEFTFLHDCFKMQGYIIRSKDLGKLYQYEGKFINNDYERSRLFSLLNKYSIFLHKQTKQDLKKGEEPKKTSYFSKRI